MRDRLFYNARSLRRNMTREEKRLWFDFLRRLPVNVFRQKVFGHYIVDFYVSSANTVIEVDGAQHYEDTGAAYDRVRDEFLSNKGLHVLRYSNHDINYNFHGVCCDILDKLGLKWDDLK